MKQMRIAFLILLCSTTLLGTAGAAPQEPLKVVLWVGGFAHEFRTVAGILTEALPKQRPMKINIAWDGEFLDAPERPDVILMYHCQKSTKDILTEPQKAKLLTVVKEGTGVVALHASYYSFLEWDEYHKFYGARFIKHGKSEARLRITPLQKQHPIFKGIDKPLELVSELYQSTPVAEDCDILAQSHEIGQDKPQPSIWTRYYGKGRIVTILPGHFAENYKAAPYQRLILNAMDWVLKGDAGGETTSVSPQYDWEKDALSAFKLPEGFEISLVAAEPHLANPISMAQDERGRIYVSNAHSYRQKWWLMNPPPKMEPSNPVVCFTLGDNGRAVEATTVAEGFANPLMGLVVRDTQLWASNLNRVFVTDLDEKGRMIGERKVLVRDAATPWNPFGMYRVVRGPDDLLYLTIGDHATQLTGADGKAAVRQDNKGSGGVFRFGDDGTDLKMLLEGMRAPFALGFTPFGKLWVITNGEGSPNCLLDAIQGTDYRFRNGARGDWFWLAGAEPLSAPAWENPPGAHTDALPYYSSNLPKEYWGNLFVSNFGVHGSPATKNEVLRLVLDERGRVLRREPFISSSDPKFRPTQVSLAPDGSLYMLDWYGKDDENDLTGRLYRIRYTGKNTAVNVVTGLGSRNHTERAKAKDALLAAGPASLPAIDNTLKGSDALAASEALWTLRRSDWPGAESHIRKAFSNGDWRVRRLAVQLLREMGSQKDEDLRKLLDDPDPAVQLEAALGIRNTPARCTAVVQALRGGAAKIRRLRFTGALEIARLGQDVHFTALLTDQDPDVQLAGLIALDEAFYESSKGFKAPDPQSHKKLADIGRSITTLKTQLNSETSQQIASRRKWETSLRQQADKANWLTLRPQKVDRRNGALKQLDDLSLLAMGEDPETDSYTLTFTSPPKGGTGLRLEVIPDSSLTGGRYSRGNGNFVLTNIRVKAGASDDLKEVSLVKAQASYEQKDWEASKAIAPDKSHGWAVDGNTKGGPVHVAVFTFANPIEGGAGQVMQIALDQDSPITHHNIGRFRLSLTTMTTPTLSESGLPSSIVDAVTLDPTKRSASQESELAALYRSTASELKPLRDEIARLEQAKTDLSDGGIAPAFVARKTLARFIANPGTLNATDLLDLARRWPHDSLKDAVDQIVKARLTANAVTATDFAQGLDALKRMGLPTSQTDIDKARIRLLDGAVQKSVTEERDKLALLKVLDAGSVRPGDLTLLKRLINDENANVRAMACSLLEARHLNEAAAVAICRELATSDKAGLAQRLDAVVTLAKLEKTPNKEGWTKLLLSSQSEVALASLRALQSFGDRAAAKRVLDNVKVRLSQQHASVVEGDLAFTIAILSGKTLATPNKLELRQQVLEGTNTANVELGRLVFRSRACYNCHIAGKAEVRAPQLAKIAATHDAAYLLDSILDPNKAVKTGFLTQKILLRNGKVITGTLRRNVSGEGRYDEVVDSTGQRKLYPSSQITDVVTTSAMPTGLEATMSKTELIDLLAYLKTLK